MDELPIDPHRLEPAVNRLCSSIMGDPRTRHISAAYLPSREAVVHLVDRLTWIMFPGFFGPRDLSPDTLRGHIGAVLVEASAYLCAQVSAALRYDQPIEPGTGYFGRPSAECDAQAEHIVMDFITQLPETRAALSLDVQAACDGDPAARHTDEVIFCYPGIRALCVHRLAHQLYRRHVPLIPRMMAEYAHSQTGIDIHPGAKVGRSFFIDHGTGVVIGETTIIGEHCKVYQGVTLGAKSFPKDERGRLQRDVKRHPTLEDHVTVYAGATILGGDTVIGAGSVINGGVFLTNSVPPGHVVRGPKVELKLRSNPEMPPANFAI
jgi:serine O-acetyltransferase